MNLCFIKSDCGTLAATVSELKYELGSWSQQDSLNINPFKPPASPVTKKKKKNQEGKRAQCWWSVLSNRDCSGASLWIISFNVCNHPWNTQRHCSRLTEKDPGVVGVGWPAWELTAVWPQGPDFRARAVRAVAMCLPQNRRGFRFYCSDEIHSDLFLASLTSCSLWCQSAFLGDWIQLNFSIKRCYSNPPSQHGPEMTHIHPSSWKQPALPICSWCLK